MHPNQEPPPPPLPPTTPPAIDVHLLFQTLFPIVSALAFLGLSLSAVFHFLSFVEWRRTSKLVPPRLKQSISLFDDSEDTEQVPLLQTDPLERLVPDPNVSIFAHILSDTPVILRWLPVACLVIVVVGSTVKYALLAYAGVPQVGYNSYGFFSLWILSSFLALSIATSSAFVLDLAGPSSIVSTTLFSIIHLFISWLDVYAFSEHNKWLECIISWIDAIQMISLVSAIAANGLRYSEESRHKILALETYKLENRTSMELQSNFFSYLTFSWLTPVVHMASKATLQASDIWQLRNCDQTDSVLIKYVRKKYQSVAQSLCWHDTTVAGLGKRGRTVIAISCCTVLLQFAGPYFINRLLKSFESLPDNPSPTAILFFIGRRQSSHARSILIAEIYAKSLRRVAGTGKAKVETIEGSLGLEETDNASTGKIISLLSVDVEKIREYVSYLYNLIIFFPISLLISILSLMSILGVIPTLCGLSVMIVMGPINFMVGGWLKTAQSRLSNATDKRINATNEVLHGIRILKYLSWEEKFSESVEKLRAIELKELYRLNLIQLLFNSSSMASGLLVSFIIFSVHSLQSETGNMDPATAFTGLYLVQQFMDILSRLPYDLMFLFQAKVAMERIQKFLDEEEVAGSCLDDALSTNMNLTSANESQVAFENASYFITSHSENISLNFRINALNAVCGSTGSGKTSLCLALLGELKQTEGRTILNDGTTNHPIRVAPQRTIRENILMGTPYNPSRYHHVLEAAALVKDLETLECGDRTEIGEKGVTLSGGQKQRISLARALYSQAKIVILDDPLSAVDAPTAKHLMLHAINGPLLANRTVILVTHAVGLVVPFAEFVVFMKAGQVVASGSPAEIARHPDVAEVTGEMVAGLNESPRVKTLTKLPSAVNVTEGTKEKELVKEEKMASGTVSYKVYWAYVKAAGGIWFALAFLLSFWFVIGVQFGNDFWLKKWSEAGKGQSGNTTFFSETQLDSMLISTIIPWSNSLVRGVSEITAMNSRQSFLMTLERNDVVYYIAIYGLFGVGIILASNFNSFLAVWCAQNAANTMHKNLMNAMLGAPLRFFEITPIGRILNRFSKDISVIDQTVMNTVRFFLNRLFVGIMVVFVVTSGSMYFLIAVIPIAYVSLHIGKLYLNASRELKRLESVSRSPIYNQFSETLNGVATIRAYRQQNRFLAQNNAKVDTNHRFFYTLWAGNRWLCVRTDLISATVVLCSGLTVIFAHSSISKGWAGIILLYAGKFSDALVWIVRMHAEMEMSLDSVERVVEYSEVTQEPARVNPAYRPPQNWPHEGRIEVKDLSIRYAEDQPCVLKRLNFVVKPGEKIGVVGELSTLSLAFFRIVPFFEGSIEIDGLDIEKLGLHDLRSKLTVIPQDPVLFEGTLRSNLNPFDEYSDEEMMQVLKGTHVLESLQRKSITSQETLVECESATSTQTQQLKEASITLDYHVTENGQNFSQGQRQLLCMARALLRNTRIVILDEATASIDGPTDARIQNTIRERLWDRTIFTIAHRLRSVADYDRILVLNYGEIVEYASPYELKPLITGQFQKMCQETGEFDEIMSIAKKAWLSKNEPN
ncbi:hypothetical protein BCR33DRAFT_712882 [Rhizoclosmatium globosum]|uniref:P-loop containing nucleoside triphosphate hydrolase protein n=1 Tax=Rhizoclosmatium globosum TaxID=329046 RepID=A0A1Y2CX59_9FUNG|nr:hypothetical protein BCR33DRAFT_712882 [Rhizoclosmatium globosum]|eukprot:ORY50925.1 hypothetical protein BCR33DRAFT_712882 [Rhizoclosmatium globosum]